MERVAGERLLVARRMFFVLVAMVGSVGVFLVGVQGQAQALAPHPPDAILKQDNRTLQHGSLMSYFWINRVVDVAPQHPSAVLVEPGTQLYIRLSENRRPEQFSLTARRPTRRIDTTLRPVVRDGKTVAWDAYFRLERPDRHYHLRASGAWEGRGGRSGDVDWLFHVKTGS
jgi:hypothetical protein